MPESGADIIAEGEGREASGGRGLLDLQAMLVCAGGEVNGAGWVLELAVPGECVGDDDGIEMADVRVSVDVEDGRSEERAGFGAAEVKN